MAILKKPQAVASGGSDWLESFQMLYAISEMAHKSYTRKLGKEKYISDAINTAYDTFKSNPNDLGALDATIKKIGEIGQNYPAAKDSLVFQNFAQKMDTLQTERLELIDVNSKLDKFRSGDYDLENFIGIKNVQGWHPEHSKGPSQTTLKIEEAIKELQLDSSDMNRMGRLSDTDRQNYSLKIAELQKLKGFVGYDGVLKPKDIKHMEIGPNISAVLNNWISLERGYKSAIDLNRERIIRIDDRTDVPAMADGTPAPLTDREKTQRQELLNTIEEDEKAYDAVHANILRYDWDYGMIGDPDKTVDDFGGKGLGADKDGIFRYKDFDAETEKEFQDWAAEPDEPKEPEEVPPTGGVVAQNRKTGAREIAVKFDGKNFLNADGDSVNVYATTKGYQELKDKYYKEEKDRQAEEAERIKLEPSVEKNEKLTKDIRSIFRKKSMKKLGVTPEQRKAMFRSIEEGTLHAIPESIFNELSPEWKEYIDTNIVAGA